MEQTKLHIRLDFAPLDIAVSVYVLSSGSPATQTYNGTTGEFEPNRLLVPTVLVPQVLLSAQDGSISNMLGNESLAQMHWYVDEEDISTLSEWAGLYEIITEGEYRGGIMIYRNLDKDELCSLHFEAVVADSRTRTNYPIITDSVILSTVEMVEKAVYNLATSVDTSIAYKPLYDTLFEYEYMVAQGMIDNTTANREAATNSSAYLKEIPLYLYGNQGVYDGDYAVKVYEVLGWQDNVLQLEEITITDDDDNEFDEISPEKLVIDLRMVDKKDYMIKAFIDDAEVASLQFSVARILTPYSVMSVNGAARKITDTMRYDRVKVMQNARVMEHPECFIRLLWKTDSYYKTEVEHGEGASVAYSIESTGAGDTVEDGWIDEYVETEHKDYHRVAVSEDEMVYTDENGNTLIFN